MSQPTPPRQATSRIDYSASNRALQQQTQGDSVAVEQMRDHRAYLDARIARIRQWVTGGVDPKALVRFALRDMAGPSASAAKLRECTPESIYFGLLACAVTGLEPGALKGEAYLVPYRNKGIMEATFIPGWKGLVKQASRARDRDGARVVLHIDPQVVFDRDLFDLDLGTANVLVHKPARGERGDIVGAYAIARMAGGSNVLEWLDRRDLDAIRNAAGQSPAWSDWEDQMHRKGPIRRLCKRLPMGVDYYIGGELDRAADEGLGMRGQREILDVEADTAGARAALDGGSAQMLAQAPPSTIPTKAEQEAIARDEMAPA